LAPLTEIEPPPPATLVDAAGVTVPPPDCAAAPEPDPDPPVLDEPPVDGVVTVVAMGTFTENSLVTPGPLAGTVVAVDEM
jgi:hypothetical protein